MLHRFARGVYPAQIFEQRRAFGVPCWMSRHPELNENIVKLLISLRPYLYRNSIETLYLVLYDTTIGYSNNNMFSSTINNQPNKQQQQSTLINNANIEQYVFRINSIVPTTPSNNNNNSSTTLLSSTSSSSSSSSSSALQTSTAATTAAATYSDIDTLCGSAITSLLMHEVTKPKVSKNITWTILIQSHDVLTGVQQSSTTTNINKHNQENEKDILAMGNNWIRVDEYDPIASIAVQQQSVDIPPSNLTSAVRSTAVKTIAAGPLFIQIAYEKGVSR